MDPRADYGPFCDAALVRYFFFELEHFLDQNLRLIRKSGGIVPVAPETTEDAFSFGQKDHTSRSYFSHTPLCNFRHGEDHLDSPFFFC